MSANSENCDEVEVSRRATSYWRDSNNTFLASTDYYERVGSTLRNEVANWISGADNALDVGCGNGRFTLELAKLAHHVTATDLSPKLIEAAIAEAKAEGVDNIAYNVVDLVSDKSRGERYDLVSCMGVLSTIVSDEHMTTTLEGLVQRIKPNGYILLRESLSETDTQRVHGASPPAVYRSTTNYAKLLAGHGLKPVYCARMKSWTASKRVNYLMLFKMPRLLLANIRFRLNPDGIFAGAHDRTS